jgi:GntR family transcriptional regulator, carbon starvation induced regulator
MTPFALNPAPNDDRTRESPTLATEIQNRLRSDILNCNLKPGQSLRFDWLRETYKISLSPLREALMRLISEGLVHLEDHRGFRVAPVSVEHLLDLTMVRKETEALAIRIAIEKGDDHWESFILASFNTLSKYPSRGGSQLFDPEWETRHRTFHYSLYAACGSPILLKTIAAFDNQWARYRLLVGKYMSRRRNLQQEHADLKDAVVARDPAAATRAIQHHLEASAKTILAAKDPIFAAPDGTAKARGTAA